MKPSHRGDPASRRRWAAMLAVGLALGACGENAFRDGITQPDPGAETPDPAQPPAATDSTPPSESRILLPLPRAIVAVGDALSVRVVASDNVALDSVMVTGFAADGTPRYQRAVKRYAAGQPTRTDTAAFVLPPVGDQPTDPVYVVATAFDRSGNSTVDSARVSLAVIRGTVIPLENKVDRLVDLVSDGRRVFVSNFSRNRVEVLDVADDRRSSFRVGAQPWGLALSPDSGTLLVANSGGTNVSVVDLAAGALAENEASRIQTPNLRLFQVPFGKAQVPDLDSNGNARLDANGDTVKVEVLSPSGVTIQEYSDRPQFVAETESGLIVYSTKPTGSAPTGTIRTARRLPDGRVKVDIFTQYPTNEVQGQVVVVNADSVRATRETPARLVVWPHPSPSPGFAIVGYIDEVAAKLRAGGYDTRIDYYLDLNELGLSDTTFVGVSGDHRTVAFGEGARETGRVVLLQQDGNELLGQVSDLVANASERVIGLALNRDGTLGAARGQEAYFFTPDLRLQGKAPTGAPTGGLAFAPTHAGYPGTSAADRLAFVSGVDDNGSPYIDVLDTFSFYRRQRIFVRQTITGALVAVRMPAGSAGTVRIYGITASGVLRVDLQSADLQP